MADRELNVRSPMLRGDDVREVQEQLAAHGHSPGDIDGIYGPNTKAAARSFQQAMGLDADGIVGPHTYAALRGQGGGQGGEHGVEQGEGEHEGGHGEGYFERLRQSLEALGIHLSIDWASLGGDPQSVEHIPAELQPYLAAEDDTSKDTGQTTVAALVGDPGEGGERVG